MNKKSLVDRIDTSMKSVAEQLNNQAALKIADEVTMTNKSFIDD